MMSLPEKQVTDLLHAVKRVAQVDAPAVGWKHVQEVVIQQLPHTLQLQGD